jgi:hypothetical protein
MKLQGVSVILVLLAIVPCCAKRWTAIPEYLTPVQGIVMLDGKPLAGVVVTFCPKKEEGSSAAGITDENGCFQLTCFPTGNGAKPGEYNVTVAARATGGYSPHQDSHSTIGTKAIPRHYGISTQTPLAATVPADRKIVLELKSKLQ